MVQLQQADGSTIAPTPVDHGFHSLEVARVVPETPDTVSLVLRVPDPLREAFTYAAGQFCTFRVPIGGENLLRCYSMSSAPETDDDLTVTVKRVPGGAVSNWINDHVLAGDEIETTCPAGVFRAAEPTTDLVMFAAGSGITPVISLVKSALASTKTRVRLLYANRDHESIIFRETLEALSTDHPDRLVVVHHLDVEHGIPDQRSVENFLGNRLPRGAQFFICGPAPFMELTEGALLGNGIDPADIHVERFSPAGGPTDVAEPGPDSADAVDPAGAATVTIELDGRTESTSHRPGTTVLQVARETGLTPPYSCESGSCATCIARLVDGAVTMRVNDALTDDEVDDGWILTCQSVPASAAIHVVYGYD